MKDFPMTFSEVRCRGRIIKIILDLPTTGHELFYRSEATLALPCPAKYTPEDSRLSACPDKAMLTSRGLFLC